MQKRGNMAFEEVIFLVLNTVFFVVLLIFIFNNTNGRQVYEQAYAKEIALLIDEAKPTMTLFLDMQDIADKYGKDVSRIVKIDSNRIIVSLGKSGGHSYVFYTQAKISLEYQSKYLVIKVE